MSIAVVSLLAAQVVAAVVLLLRLGPGRTRTPAVRPLLAGEPDAAVSVVVPTLDEARRIPPLLDGIVAQGRPVAEVLFVDSGSTDGTTDLIAEAARRDARIRLERDPPLPPGWIGKAWALQHGAGLARGPWLLGLDADTRPRPGLAAAVVRAAEEGGYDAVSFAPRFVGQSALERWLQPAILATLVFRFGPPRADMPPDRVLANGQCFLVRRDMLLAHGGYEPVRASFAEDVSLARHLARTGARVGFLDGRLLYDVRSYESASEMWREWGRSVDLKDATSPLCHAVDIAFLVFAQALPVPVLVATALAGAGDLLPLVLVNAVLVGARVVTGVAMAPSYECRGVAYWLSPLADPLAVLRVVVSSLRRARRWRTRAY